MKPGGKLFNTLLIIISGAIIYVLFGTGSTTAPTVPLSMQEDEDQQTKLRREMVEKQLRPRLISDPAVLSAMETVPRHLFIPSYNRRYAYMDSALPIDRGQTISQPFIVALMTQLSEVKSGEKVLEIGTGSGYQAAVLAEITDSVFSIEIDPVLANTARKALDATGYTKVVSKSGDGYEGWAEHAPFDAVIVTAAAPRIPEPLKEQLKVGGILIIPVGETDAVQRLLKITRTEKGFETEEIEWVRFVPMTGKVRDKH